MGFVAIPANRKKVLVEGTLSPKITKKANFAIVGP